MGLPEAGSCAWPGRIKEAVAGPSTDDAPHSTSSGTFSWLSCCPHPTSSNLSYFQPAHNCGEADVYTEHYVQVSDGEKKDRIKKNYWKVQSRAKIPGIAEKDDTMISEFSLQLFVRLSVQTWETPFLTLFWAFAFKEPVLCWLLRPGALGWLSLLSKVHADRVQILDTWSRTGAKLLPSFQSLFLLCSGNRQRWKGDFEKMNPYNVISQCKGLAAFTAFLLFSARPPFGKIRLGRYCDH